MVAIVTVFPGLARPQHTTMSAEEGAPSIMTTLTTAVMKDVPSTAAAAAVASTSSSSSSAAAAGSEPSVNQKLFLVVSVALATVCFFTNVLQVRDAAPASSSSFLQIFPLPKCYA